jgi:glycosyltransferase involved in cell wall biosynthesis
MKYDSHRKDNEDADRSHKPPERPIKVVRVISGLWPGGVEKKLTALLPLLDKNRFNVCVVCLKAEGELAPLLREKGIPVTVIKMPSRWSPKGLLNLGRYFRREKIDIVHTHMYRANISGTVAARLAGVPVVIANIHNVDAWDNPSQVRTDRLLAKRRDCTVFVSNAVRDDYLGHIKLPDTACRIIYNGVDTRYFTPSGSQHERKGTLRVGVAARLMPQKNLEFLVDAAADSGFQRLNTHFYIAGDGPLRDELTASAQRKGAADYFHMSGFTDDVRDFYRSLDVFVLPSLKEGFSNALLEAMACGLPVVASAVGGNPEAVRDGQNGFLVPAADYSAFRRALHTMLHDDDRRKKMAEESIRVARTFSLNEMAAETERLYMSLWLSKTRSYTSGGDYHEYR